MRRSITIPVVALLCAAFLSAPACADPVRSGRKAFERAWPAWQRGNQENAAKYFEQAASAYAEMLAAGDKYRSASFASNLGMAGMSFYFTGKYAECISTMEQAAARDPNLWEAYLFSGLASARLGNAEAALSQWKLFQEKGTSQRFIQQSVGLQVTNLETGEGSLEAAVAPVEKATWKQFRNNATFRRADDNEPNSRCSGSYWWRNSRTPCEGSPFRKWI
ncbi:tetratricopeptide repeat protein [Pseudodesulfovibrio tunisiensis]|uniref:tetratricopeptide repeat protein n=1 Tax=Pseudodesulfovibrio tunisiensis TaxID=463192 RepID=UPI001FB5217E|nr:tetratricopeptide repeat protein [Pseudodesulfovibrio tunisiensis]